MIQWIAFALTATGELFLLQGRPELVIYSYGFFLVGNLLWLKIGLEKKMKPLVLLNITFIIMSVIGFINWSVI